MIRAGITEKRAIPLWAAVGAPLIGVPLMVLLLSLAAPEGRARTELTEVEFATERLDAAEAERIGDVTTAYIPRPDEHC